MSLRVGFRNAVCVRERSQRVSLRVAWIVLVATAFGLSGCKVFNSTCAPDDRTCLSGGSLRSDQVCLRTGDCAQGLSCQSGICAYAGTTKRAGKCTVTAECAKGLYCGIDLQCKPINDNPQPENGPCASSAECEKGLVCDIDIAKLFKEGPFGLIPEDCRAKLPDDDTPEVCKLPRQCTKRGRLELGVACKKQSDCLAGLFCGRNPLDATSGDVCVGGVALRAEPVSASHWDGVRCSEDAKTPVAYFEVPRAGASKDFYRLPFPNDVRRRDGGIDLSDHPRPPADALPETAARFIEAAGSVDGFATNPVVYFRFSQAIDAGNLSLNTVRIVDITKGSPEYGQKASIAWGPAERQSHYICPHWLALHRPLGLPLRPGTTYAALISTAIHSKSGAAFDRSSDFEVMLDAQQPKDPDLAQAWDAYAPLRAYVASASPDFPNDQLLNAAVFTTERATELVPKLRAAVEADRAPAVSDLTLCAAGTKSPCEDATGRGACHAENSDFAEIHGHIALPMFQSGTAPYEKPQDGGEIALAANGNPELQDHAKVCFALSVPKSNPPAAGYPLLIVAHGTGGAFSDPMGGDDTAKWAAHAATPSAVLSIDLPVHGSRRGASTRPPEDLFFNFQNPAAARGNALQGSADLMSLTLLAAVGIPQAGSPTSKAITFDPTRVVLYGHSQGATHAALMLAYESRVRAAVLSGMGGHVATSLQLEQKPVDIGSVLPFALFDADDKGDLVGGDVNPVLALIQGYFEAADPINYARLLYQEPVASAPDGHDVFMTYGLFDNYCPEKTQEAYALAGGLSAATPDLAMRFGELLLPVRNNVKPGARTRTVALRTYDPIADPLEPGNPQDGHFVARSTKRGLTDVRRFLEQALKGETPQIGE
jgi:predicted esterase